MVFLTNAYFCFARVSQWKPSVYLLQKPTLKNGSVLNDEDFQLSAGSLETGLHILFGNKQVALLHFAGTAGQAFRLAHLQIWACRIDENDNYSRHDKQANGARRFINSI